MPFTFILFRRCAKWDNTRWHKYRSGHKIWQVPTHLLKRFFPFHIQRELILCPIWTAASLHRRSCRNAVPARMLAARAFVISHRCGAIASGQCLPIPDGCAARSCIAATADNAHAAAHFSTHPSRLRAAYIYRGIANPERVCYHRQDR